MQGLQLAREAVPGTREARARRDDGEAASFLGRGGPAMALEAQDLGDQGVGQPAALAIHAVEVVDEEEKRLSWPREERLGGAAPSLLRGSSVARIERLQPVGRFVVAPLP